MGKLQTGRFERLAARTYSIKGPGALVDLDETVLGVLQLERQAGIESHMIQGWETFGTRVSVGPVVGQYAFALLSNPVGSNRLMVLDSWQFYNAALTVLMVTRGVPPGFVAAGVATGLDTRIPFSRQPAGRMFTDNTATSSFGSSIGMAATTEQQRYQIVLGPDGSVVWGSQGTNQDLLVSIRWAERDAAPFEL